ncbi:ImmA/IrrE family metallo-endopeptidase [Agrococcus sp. KRD186]|uniref:ImmA/IrrE family metallo-endopeptidase n=1 Tax=Agrococcus sp. KRD186 TaxID=2729730 RepID=UPI0019D13AAD|nr:ImmA/IrrE family metallo-endopeptidase [Agrococcus sp. KRD186]
MATTVEVAPAVLAWAQERSRRDPGAYASKFGSWESWLAGEKKPTIKQLEELAKYAHVPFGVFFLDKPPVVELPIPDYRLGVTGDRATPSQDLLAVIELSQQRQGWFRDYALEHGLGDARFAGATEQDEVREVAARATEELDFDVRRRSGMTRDGARNHLRRRFEERGGLAVITSMVGNDTHRPLDRREFRGFTLADETAPLVFVNANDDSKSGQLFTFLHEYGHVLLRRSGVSDEEFGEVTAGVEGWCNAFAAEVLVPEADLEAQFRPEVDVHVELERLAGRYLCSTLVIVLKLRDARLVRREGFDDLYRAVEQRAREAFERSRTASKGGDFYANQPFRIGERFSRAVLAGVAEGKTGYTDAFRLLGLRSAEQLGKYAKQLGM